MRNEISVFLVAGNRLLREALAKLLRKKSDLKVCSALPCVPEVIASIATSSADVLILDSVTARLSNFSLISEIGRRLPNLKIVLIDMEEDVEVFLDCVRAGATGFLLKDASAADVVSGIRSVADGMAVCPPQFCLALFHAVADQWKSSPKNNIQLEVGLTRRQQQIIPLIGQGLTNKEICSILNLSEQTVKNHVHQMLRRFGAKDRLHLISLMPHFRMPIQSMKLIGRTEGAGAALSQTAATAKV